MSNITKLSLAGILLIVIVISNSIFVISEVERGVTLRFGQMIEADVKPGIHVKIPFVDDVRRFDARILTVDATPDKLFYCRKEAINC